jgi:hypothetical protein
MKLMTEKKALRWEKEREKGKYFWITKLAFFWGIFVFSFSNLINWLLGIETHFLSFYGLFTYILGGFFVGTISWKIHESEYKKYLLESEKINELKY